MSENVCNVFSNKCGKFFLINFQLSEKTTDFWGMLKIPINQCMQISKIFFL